MGRSRSRSRSRGRRYRSPSTSDRSRSRSASPEGYRVHVADLGLDPSKREIEKHFEVYGPLIEVWVAKNPPCFAFVVYKYKDDADMAIREMDGKYGNFLDTSFRSKCFPLRVDSFIVYAIIYCIPIKGVFTLPDLSS